MRHSLLGQHYRELVNLKRITDNTIRGTEQYRRDILRILEQVLELEQSGTTQYPLGPTLTVDLSEFKQELVTNLSQNRQQLEQFYYEKRALEYNLAKLPLG